MTKLHWNVRLIGSDNTSQSQDLVERLRQERIHIRGWLSAVDIGLVAVEQAGMVFALVRSWLWCDAPARWLGAQVVEPGVGG